MKETTSEMLEFKFAGMGSDAPEPVPQNEIWLDVGNRIGVRVLDHHRGGGTSAAKLALTRVHDLVVPHVDTGAPLRIVVHQDPDLDSICSAWLVKKQLFDKIDIQGNAAIGEMVRVVDDNDQGLVRTTDPLQCWPVVMRTLIGKKHGVLANERIMEETFILLERTFEILSHGGTLADAANAILTPELRVLLSLEQKDYQQDLANGFTFQVALPLRSAFAGAVGAGSRERRVVVDGLLLQNPTSPLFKELARTDRENSPLKQGFPLLVVVHDFAWEDGRTYQHYIISVDPLTGLYLKGLGEILEAREQAKEDQLGKPLLPGRERVEPGKGRFGGTIVSPWYDGRGHDFTIIDCPSIGRGKKNPCFSQLSRDEVMEQIWNYSDPALFVEIRAGERIQLHFAPLSAEAAGSGVDCASLDSMIRRTDGQCRWGNDIKLLAGNCSLVEGPDGNKQWRFFSAVSIASRRAPYDKKGASSLRQAIDVLAARQSEEASETTLSIIDVAESQFHRLDIDSLLVSLHYLACGRKSAFPGVREQLDSARPVRIDSPDRKGIFLIYPRGCILVRSMPTAGEPMAVEPFEMLLALAAASKRRLDMLSADILAHMRASSPAKMGKLLQRDREALLRFQQAALFGFACEEPFVQQVYEALQAQWQIPRRFEQESQRVNVLAQSFREASDALSAKLSFIVTTAIAPLLLALAFFSATFMDTEFHVKYRTFFPSKFILWLAKTLGISTGWSAFIAVLGAFGLFFSLLWMVITRMNRK